MFVSATALTVFLSNLFGAPTNFQELMSLIRQASSITDSFDDSDLSKSSDYKMEDDYISEPFRHLTSI